VDGSSHIYYIDPNQQHIEHILWTGLGWLNEDITAASGAATVAAAGSSLTSYFVPADGSSHIYYIDPNQHIEHVLWTGQNWRNEDITAASGAATVAAAGSALTSYFVPADGSSHIYYTDPNQHIEHVLWTGQSWRNEDITAASSAATVAAAGSSLTSYFVPVDGSSHIYYIDPNQHIEHVWWAGQGWANQDTTAASSAVTVAAAGSALTSYFAPVDGSSHIYYIDPNQHIEHVWWAGQGWLNEDTTAAAGSTTAAAPGSALTSYFAAPDSSSHVYFSDTAGNSNELLYVGAWYDLNLASLYSISGQVTAGSGPIPGVTMTLSGATAGAATTDSNGNYAFAVPAGGSYTVTPSDASWDGFSPALQTFSNVNSNQTANFSAASGTTGLNGPPIPQPPPISEPPPGPPPVVSASASNCNDLSGSWVDEASSTFSLSQTGSTITGTTVLPDSVCGDVTYKINGQSTGNGTFSLTEFNPNPPVDSCGQTLAPQESSSVTIVSCSQADETFTGSGGASLGAIQTQFKRGTLGRSPSLAATPAFSAAPTHVWSRISNPPDFRFP